MLRNKLLLTLVIFSWMASTTAAQTGPSTNPASSKKQDTAANQIAADKIKVLIVDGQNNHGDWPKISAMLKQYLLRSERFTVDLQRTKFLWRGDKWLDQYGLDDQDYQRLKQPKSDPNFRPRFSDYDVVVSNFGHNAAAWPQETQTAFDKFVGDGGGLVVLHAADNSFPKWKAYNQMIGLGGWGGRNEKDGPFVYYDNDDKLIRDDSKGSGGSHGPQHEYHVVARDTDHPIMKGLPKSFLHAKDELYQRLRGPAVNMTILATAYSAKEFRGTSRHEPIVMTIDYGKGRVFHTPMGHADYSCECVGMITLMLRGTEWAATGKVTLPIPKDFPTANASSQRSFVAQPVN